MTEREKMLAGELYSPADPELRKMYLRSKKLCGKINKCDPSNENKIEKMVKKIIDLIEDQSYLDFYDKLKDEK